MANTCENFDDLTKKVEEYMFQLFQWMQNGEYRAYTSPEDDVDLWKNNFLKNQPDLFDNVINAYEKIFLRYGEQRCHPMDVAYVTIHSQMAATLGKMIGSTLSVDNLRDAECGKFDKAILDWMAGMFGYPESARGYIASSATVGTELAMCCAREKKKLQTLNYTKSVVYVSASVHTCVQKALQVVGMGDVIICTIPVDRQGKIITSKLQQQILKHESEGLLPFVLCSTMCTVDIGAIDPLEEMGNIAQKHNLWFHVDAALGGFLLLDERFSKHRAGMSRTDSLVCDPHKLPSMPIGHGTVLVKDGAMLSEALETTNELIPSGYGSTVDENCYIPGAYTFESDRPFRGFTLWFALNLLGLERLKTMIQEKIDLTAYCFQELEAIPGIVMEWYPETLIVCFRLKDGDGDERTECLLKDIQTGGEFYAVPIKFRGRTYIRLAMNGALMHKVHVDNIVNIVKRLLHEMNIRNIAKTATCKDYPPYETVDEAKQWLQQAIQFVTFKSDPLNENSAATVVLTLPKKGRSIVSVLKDVDHLFPDRKRQSDKFLIFCYGSMLESLVYKYGSIYSLAPGAAQLEALLVQRFARGCGLPSDSVRGVFHSSTGSALLTTIAMVREDKCHCLQDRHRMT